MKHYIVRCKSCSAGIEPNLKIPDNVSLEAAGGDKSKVIFRMKCPHCGFVGSYPLSGFKVMRNNAN